MAKDTAYNRQRAVLHAMPVIRRLLRENGFEVDAYSDGAIADALLETCPTPSDFWLRTEHLTLAVQRLRRAFR